MAPSRFRALPFPLLGSAREAPEQAVALASLLASAASAALVAIVTVVVIIVAMLVMMVTRKRVVVIPWHTLAVDDPVVPLVVMDVGAAVPVRWVLHKIQVHNHPKGESTLATTGRCRRGQAIMDHH